MKRDTRIVGIAAAAFPALVLAAATLCAWAIANGASRAWRIPFRAICHGFPERSLAVCARCTGIYAGILAGLALFRLLPPIRERVLRVVALAALTPLAIDGLTQLTGLRESTNPLRIATGLIAGLAFGLWILGAVQRHGDAPFTTS
jgi:uncharacterized membrane protein